MPKTMFEKIWNLHLVHEQDGNSIIYIDRHLVHEVTSPQAFEGLRLAGRRVLHPEATFAVPDHNIPTVNQDQPIRIQFLHYKLRLYVRTVENLELPFLIWEMSVQESYM